MNSRFPVVSLLAFASLGWTVLLAVAPGWRTGGEPQRDVAGFVYLVSAGLCHQQPARSFRVAGTRMPVCARCTGLYAGAALGALAAAIRVSRPFSRRLGEVDARGARVLLAAAAVPTVATLVAEFALALPVGNAARAIAGIPLGAVAAWLVAAAIGDPVARRSGAVIGHAPRARHQPETKHEAPSRH